MTTVENVGGALINPLKTVLNVGCGPRGRRHGFAGFDPGWSELRLDIDPAVQPDVLGTMTDMSAVATGSVDAVVSSHNIEHLYPHEVPLALAEFVRVLKPDGRLLITCPDLQSVCARVAKGELASTLYVSAAGPISALDMMYGHRAAMAAGNLFMADTLLACGFARTAGIARPEAFDLWVVASKAALSDVEIRALAVLHLPRRG